MLLDRANLLDDILLVHELVLVLIKALLPAALHSAARMSFRKPVATTKLIITKTAVTNHCLKGRVVN